MNILFYGTPKEVIPVLEQLHKHFTVVGVITNPDQKAGRKQLLTPPPVKVFAEQNNIKVFQPETLKDFSISTLKELKPDIAVVAAYGKLIPSELLDIPTYGSINIHPSLLPKYRGPTPIQTALLDGIKESGISVIQMDAELDHGPILHQTHYKISDTDTFDWLMRTMFGQAAALLPHVIQEFAEGKIKAKPQDHDDATFTKAISKQDGFIDLDNPPTREKLDNMIRAYFPWPNVWTKVKLENGQEKIVKFLPEKNLQMEGKNPVSLKDFLNGYPELQPLLQHLF